MGGSDVDSNVRDVGEGKQKRGRYVQLHHATGAGLEEAAPGARSGGRQERHCPIRQGKRQKQRRHQDKKQKVLLTVKEKKDTPTPVSRDAPPTFSFPPPYFLVCLRGCGGSDARCFVKSVYTDVLDFSFFCVHI